MALQRIEQSRLNELNKFLVDRSGKRSHFARIVLDELEKHPMGEGLWIPLEELQRVWPDVLPYPLSLRFHAALRSVIIIEKRGYKITIKRGPLKNGWVVRRFSPTDEMPFDTRHSL